MYLWIITNLFFNCFFTYPIAFFMSISGSDAPPSSLTKDFSSDYELSSSLSDNFDYSLDSIKEACFLVRTLFIISLKEMKLFFWGLLDRLGHSYATGLFVIEKAFPDKVPISSLDLISFCMLPTYRRIPLYTLTSTGPPSTSLISPWWTAALQILDVLL